MMIMFIVLLVLSGGVSFILNKKHLLLALMSMEYLILPLYLGMFIYLNLMNYEQYFSLIFLSISVCESALGLSLLVSLIRTHGNDYVKNMVVLW
uniref:NADH-ubiquinone oxidoreductase chain 4L n=1 Tax=Phloiophilus edwardsi TaxID=295730 RepID=A0A0S2MR20_9CUCU|nr:NADH deshydrogenase subunit 4L [Phloiophilus edwardsi]